MAVVLGVAALREPIGLGLIIGFPLVMLGAVLAGRADKATLDPTDPDFLPAGAVAEPVDVRTVETRSCSVALDGLRIRGPNDRVT